MNLKKAFLPAMLVAGWLLIAGVAAAGDIERSTDQQGTIHIINRNPAKPEKPGDQGAAATPAIPPPPQPPPGPGQAMPPGPPALEAEAQRRAILERRRMAPHPGPTHRPRRTPGETPQSE